MWALVVAAPRLQGTGSIVAAPGRSHSAVRGIFLDQGSNLRLLHWQGDSSPLSHQGSPIFNFLLKILYWSIVDIVVLVSGVQHGDSGIPIQVSILSQGLFFHLSIVVKAEVARSLRN